MREIRFRAWDGSRMYYFNNFEWTLDYNDISGWNIVKNLPPDQLKGRKWDAGESSSTAEHFQLMQFTGLHDKTGKEIYEGDILSEAGYPFEVIWDVNLAKFRLQWRGKSIQYPEWNRGIEMEIIGNIFEGKHLLK